MKMIPEYKGRMALRLSEKERQAIENLVREGKFKSLSHVIRTALHEFLSRQNDKR
jgi:Arc/MetJ-type ribon-helix-helix transcriptional regulator